MAQLTARQAELGDAGCEVAVVTFGEETGAVRWQRETQCTFPYLRDQSRALYHHLGIKRSVKQVWNISTLSFYGGEKARGTPLPASYTDIEDDPHQMGGDVIVDRSATVKFIYRSKMPHDRPSVDLILHTLNNIQRYLSKI